MGEGFKLLSKDFVEDFFKVTSNPIVSLFIGLFATALMQSSSTTTSIIVALVAAGTLPFNSAIPMIMGANIGTSVTSTIVALGHIHNKDEFRYAISAATVHDFFNILVVVVLLPLELATGFLSSSALFLSELFPIYNTNEGSKGFLDQTIKPATKWIVSILHHNIFFIVSSSLILLIVSLRGFTLVLKNFLIGQSEQVVNKYVFGHPIQSLMWGALITAGVQSSSVTASLTVPLVASKRASLEKVFPFLIGANMGTTVTALIAALSQNETALAIALVHLLFNLCGVLFFFPLKFIRNIPVWLANRLGKLSENNRLIGIAYILVVFFLVPLLFSML
jgi:sodium-dependent phosphate cotransporter